MLCYLKESQVINMTMVNRIAFCVISSVIWMVNDQDVQEEYLHRFAERSHYVEFFFSLIALNLQGVSQDTFHIKFENYENLLNLSSNAKRNKKTVINEGEALKFITDEKFKTKDNVLKMYEDLTLVSF